MAKFAKAEIQAGSVMKRLQGCIIHSKGTIRNYEWTLKRIAQYCTNNRINVYELTSEIAVTYFEQRSEEVGQKTLDTERQAMQAMMTHVTHVVEPNTKLAVIKSEHQQIFESHAYSQQQLALIVDAQSPLTLLLQN